MMPIVSLRETTTPEREPLAAIRAVVVQVLTAR
jgi:hypothetical protein